ncbi:MAG TPA: hypothetical protein VNL35_09350 [Chloroflexota bacterium]|nr:hypothetical protein [Chloroflexota bacterium]
MAGKQEVEAIGRLDGVIEATLCGPGGELLESSSRQPVLGASAAGLGRALRDLQSSLPIFNDPVTITIEGEQGALHVAQLPDAMLLVSTEPDTNLGVLRLEIRQTLHIGS